MTKIVKLTKEGYEKLKKEIEDLQKQRPKIAKRLEEAIAEGDLSENAAYEDAKEQQSRTEGRISEIKRILNSAEIIEERKSDSVRIGATLKVKSPDGAERVFGITGREEADPGAGKISYDSPLGSAFMGHKKGDKIDVETPGGKKKYEILDVS